MKSEYNKIGQQVASLYDENYTNKYRLSLNLSYTEMIR